jgi:enamine deaminase RidA (YjgF/YER057c/UK114 family)
MKPELEFSNPAGIHPPTGPYSHVVPIPAGAELFYISGQFGVRPDGSVAAGVYDQADQAFKNLFVLLNAHGMSAKNIVKLTTFIVAGQDSPRSTPLRSRFEGNLFGCQRWMRRRTIH